MRENKENGYAFIFIFSLARMVRALRAGWPRKNNECVKRKRLRVAPFSAITIISCAEKVNR